MSDTYEYKLQFQFNKRGYWYDDDATKVPTNPESFNAAVEKLLWQKISHGNLNWRIMKRKVEPWQKLSSEELKIQKQKEEELEKERAEEKVDQEATWF